MKKVAAILHSKLRMLKKRSRSVKRRTAAGLDKTISSFLTRSRLRRRTTASRRHGRRPPVVYPNKPPPSSSGTTTLQNRRGRTFAAVYVDDLYYGSSNHTIEESTTASGEDNKIHSGAEQEADGSRAGTDGGHVLSLRGTTDPGRASRSFAPRVDVNAATDAGEKDTLHGHGVDVDLKAEIFIARFRREIRLQRQRSFEEYQEMLARGL